MNRLFVALPVLLCIAGAASSQSLADIATKEKERRKDNAEQGNKTTLEAEGVGAFGHVWWRANDVTTALGEAAQVEDTPTAPSAESEPEATPATPATTTTKGGTMSKRGELPLRKSGGRRR